MKRHLGKQHSRLYFGGFKYALQIAVLFIFVHALPVFAEQVEFPDEELAKESVNPVFDQNEAVKKRNVGLARKIEIGIFAGASLNDPFYNSYPVGGNFFYHFSEFHGMGLVGSYSLRTKSSYAAQLDNQLGNASDPNSIPNRIKLNDMPSPRYYAMALYEFTPYYGKVSFTKQTVLNLTLAFSAGAGTINLGEDSSLNLAFGMNQRLYLNKRFGLRASLEAFLYQQKDYVVRINDNTNIEKKNVLTFFFTGGVVFLL